MPSTTRTTRTLRAAFVTALGMVGIATAARANLVEYDWVEGSGPGGTGSMVFDIGSSTNGASFSVPTSSLTSFTFRFSNGDVINLAGLNAISVSGGRWTAANGYLTTTAQLSKTTLPRDTFQYAPYSISSPNPNGSTAVDQDSSPLQQNFGVWKQGVVTTVPLPAAGWLLAPGLIGLVRLAGGRGRRRSG